VFVAVVRIELHIPAARSLKEKRAVVKPVIEGIRHRFSLSVAEVGYQDKWQRSEIGIAVVSSTPSQASAVVDSVERFVWSRPDVEVCAFKTTWQKVDEDSDGS
jgi:uncharacterized protein YlxP (DUF503 family)